jgi:hypothetical protein
MRGMSGCSLSGIDETDEIDDAVGSVRGTVDVLPDA